MKSQFGIAYKHTFMKMRGQAATPSKNQVPVVETKTTVDQSKTQRQNVTD